MGLASLLVWVVTAASAGASADVQPAPAISAQLDAILADPGLKRAKVGAMVVRLSDGAELYNRNGAGQLIPASNVKLITTAAALHRLTPDYTFTTDMFATNLNGGIVGGDLVIRGNGDPFLVPERVWYLASRLYFLGIREIHGDVVVDDSYFGGQRMANGWQQDRTSSAYMAPSGAVSVGFNALMVHVLPGAKAGDDARVLLDPVSAYATVQSQVKTVDTGHSNVNVDVVPQGDHSVVRLTGRITVSDQGRGYWRRIDNPPLFAGEVVRSVLRQVGIAVGGKVRTGTVPPDATKLVSFTSPRLAELLGPLNKYSNNFMASQLAYALGAARYGAPGDWDKGKRAIQEFLANEVRIPADSYELNNASGLHDVNHFSPKQIVQLLTYMHRQANEFPEYVDSLAVAGGSGTLQDRMVDTAAAHVLRAKTGTLSSSSALSGYVTTRNGEPLAFSVIVNGYQKIDAVWAAQDRFGAALAALQLDASTAPAPAAAPPTSPPPSTSARTLTIRRWPI